MHFDLTENLLSDMEFEHQINFLIGYTNEKCGLSDLTLLVNGIIGVIMHSINLDLNKTFEVDVKKLQHTIRKSDSMQIFVSFLIK